VKKLPFSSSKRQPTASRKRWSLAAISANDSSS